jgi:apolipoprotein N-acyltransferase
VSAIVDPVGRVVTHTGTFRQEAARGQVAWLDGGTPYRLWGDVPWWLATLLIVAMGFRGPRRPVVGEAGQPAPPTETAA